MIWQLTTTDYGSPTFQLGPVSSILLPCPDTCKFLLISLNYMVINDVHRPVFSFISLFLNISFNSCGLRFCYDVSLFLFCFRTTLLSYSYSYCISSIHVIRFSIKIHILSDTFICVFDWNTASSCLLSNLWNICFVFIIPHLCVKI